MSRLYTWLYSFILIVVWSSSGSTQTTDTSLGQWLVPLPQIPISDSFPAWLNVSIRSDQIVIEDDKPSGLIIGQLQGFQPTVTGWQASSLIFKLVLFGPVPAELKLSNVNLGRDSTGLGWQLTASTVEVNNPYYSLRINSPVWIWTQQGTWQAETGRLHLQVPIQLPVSGNNNQNDYKISRMLLEVSSTGLKGQGSSAGWQGQIGMTNLSVPVADQGNGTVYGQGRVHPMNIKVVADGRFFIGNEGGLVDRGLVYWLLGGDYGQDFPMKPLRIEGFATLAGMKLKSRNLLPWLDLWFGEPGAATRHLQVTHQDGIEVLDVSF